MVSFQHKLARGLETRGFQAVYDLKDTPYAAALVIGGIKDLAGLRRVKHKGIPVIQRLDGMNWLHRKRRTGLRHYLRAEYGNTLLALIRGRLANRIIYQSRFSQAWWEKVRGPTRVPCRVIYNGVDLDTFTPDGPHRRTPGAFRMLMVEGSLGGGYEMGLETAARLVEHLRPLVDRPVELTVTGKISTGLQEQWQRRTAFPLHFTGQVDHRLIPEIDRSAHALYSADLNAACPNSVIEALACGLPVAAFETGALSELVTGDAGRVTPYGGNPWLLEQPDTAALAQAVAEILLDQDRFRPSARLRAETKFGLDAMVEGYLEFLLA